VHRQIGQHRPRLARERLIRRLCGDVEAAQQRQVELRHGPRPPAHRCLKLDHCADRSPDSTDSRPYRAHFTISSRPPLRRRDGDRRTLLQAARTSWAALRRRRAVLQPDRCEMRAWNPMKAAFAGYRGGIAPSRYEVALADYLDRQEADRQSRPRATAGAGLVALFRRAMPRIGRGEVRLGAGGAFAPAWERPRGMSHERAAWPAVSGHVPARIDTHPVGPVCCPTSPTAGRRAWVCWS
jgi:hypothetical protein